MRRTLPVILTLFAVLSWASLPAFSQDDNTPAPTLAFSLATNTPRPTVPASFDLATNTPTGPTSTPSATPTATFTPTNTPTATATPTSTPSPTPTPIGPFSYPEGINSLTGLPYPNQAALERRNLLVKISNYPPVVRPQTGVNAADVVYEYEVEGGVTRFAAIYRSNAPEVVGPVRSGRLMDLNLVPMYEALFSYSGASTPVQDLILSQDWRWQVISPSIGDNCAEAGFCRVERPGIDFEHTLFADTNMIWERATERGVNTNYRAKGFTFGDAPPDGLVANDILIDWYGQIRARWQYDAETERYLRFTDDVPHYDTATDEQLWADNLVIIEVEHENRPDLFESGASNNSIDINLVDQGRAYVLREGVYYQGYWLRRSEDPGDALQLIFGDNTPMKLKPGRTWVSVVRWLGEVNVYEEQVDAMATATVIMSSATPTVTPSPTFTPTLTTTPSPTSTPTPE